MLCASEAVRRWKHPANPYDNKMLYEEKKMRKAQKQQIEELVRQMEEAHDQIKKYIGQDRYQSAMELLGDCQNGGIAIGTLIEGTEGEGHPAVLLLEEYCEFVYCVHEKWQ